MGFFLLLLSVLLDASQPRRWGDDEDRPQTELTNCMQVGWRYPANCFHAEPFGQRSQSITSFRILGEALLLLDPEVAAVVKPV